MFPHSPNLPFLHNIDLSHVCSLIIGSKNVAENVPNEPIIQRIVTSSVSCICIKTQQVVVITTRICTWIGPNGRKTVLAAESGRRLKHNLKKPADQTQVGEGGKVKYITTNTV